MINTISVHWRSSLHPQVGGLFLLFFSLLSSVVVSPFEIQDDPHVHPHLRSDSPLFMSSRQWYLTPLFSPHALNIYFLWYMIAATYRSGLPWASGESTPANGISVTDAELVVSQINEFESYRGRNVGIISKSSSPFTLPSCSLVIHSFLFYILITLHPSINT